MRCLLDRAVTCYMRTTTLAREHRGCMTAKNDDTTHQLLPGLGHLQSQAVHRFFPRGVALMLEGRQPHGHFLQRQKGEAILSAGMLRGVPDTYAHTTHSASTDFKKCWNLFCIMRPFTATNIILLEGAESSNLSPRGVVVTTTTQGHRFSPFFTVTFAEVPI